MIQAISILLCSILMAWGGATFHNARRYGIPLILTGAAVYLVHEPWAMTMLGAIIFLTLGYGEKSSFKHIFGDGWGRGVYGLLVALALSLAMFLTGHLAWYWFAAYLAAGFILENALKNLWQVAGDLIIGSYYGSLVIMLH